MYQHSSSQVTLKFQNDADKYSKKLGKKKSFCQLPPPFFFTIPLVLVKNYRGIRFSIGKQCNFAHSIRKIDENATLLGNVRFWQLSNINSQIILTYDIRISYFQDITVKILTKYRQKRNLMVIILIIYDICQIFKTVVTWQIKYFLSRHIFCKSCKLIAEALL